MPVPSNITDLSTTAGSNSPAGTDPIGTDADNYIRAHAAFIAALRDGSKNLEAGTATAPSCAFTGDTNTGIYSPAADTIAITVGGAEACRVTSAGNFHVGSYSASNYKLFSYINAGAGTAALFARQAGAGDIALFAGSAGSSLWTIDSTGKLFNAGNTQPSFYAYTSDSRSTTGAYVTFAGEKYDQGNCFNTSTGTFTAPVAGIYIFAANVQGVWSSGGGNSYFNASTFGAFGGVWQIGASPFFYDITGLCRLAASETVQCLVTVSGSGLYTCNSFSGHLLG